LLSGKWLDARELQISPGRKSGLNSDRHKEQSPREWMIGAVRDILRALRGDAPLAQSPLVYGFAILCVALAALAHIAILNVVDGVTPSILYNPAIFIAALIGGAGAGCAAAALSLAVLWLALRGGLYDASLPNTVLDWAIYSFTAGLIVLIAQCYRSFANTSHRVREELSGGAGQGTFSRFSSLRRSMAHRIAASVAPNSITSYLFALACVIIASLIRIGFATHGGEMLPLVSYYPAMLLAGLAGGTGPALLAMLASLLVLAVEFPTPIISFDPPAREEGVSLSLYVFACVLSIWLAEKHRHASVLRYYREAVVLRLVTSMLVAIAAILLTTLVLLAVDSSLDADHLVLGYLIPTVVIAMHYGSTLAVLTSFGSSLVAAYFLFPPKFSFFISEPTHMAELGLFLVLAVIASKAVAALTDDMREQDTPAREHGA
jgi:hypothetical protein